MKLNKEQVAMIQAGSITNLTIPATAENKRLGRYFKRPISLQRKNNRKGKIFYVPAGNLHVSEKPQSREGHISL